MHFRTIHSRHATHDLTNFPQNSRNRACNSSVAQSGDLRIEHRVRMSRSAFFRPIFPPLKSVFRKGPYFFLVGFYLSLSIRVTFTIAMCSQTTHTMHATYVLKLTVSIKVSIVFNVGSAKWPDEDSFRCEANALADLATSSQLVSDEVTKLAL